jgi:hypothetical protein
LNHNKDLMKKHLKLLLQAAFYLTVSTNINAQACTPVAVTKTNPFKLYMHYLPWYTAPENPGNGTTSYGNGNTGTVNKWGQHWWNEGSNTNHPDNLITVTNYLGASVQARDISSHYHPLIGPYDGQDTSVIQYHLLLMKLCGIDGLVIDWYGSDGLYDHPPLLVNSNAIISQLNNVGMKYAIMMEDGGYSYSQLQTDGAYAVSNYFPTAQYVKLGDMRGPTATNASSPLVGVFGPGNNSSVDTQGPWNTILSGNTGALVTFMDQSKPIGSDAAGEFAWPQYSTSYATGYYNVFNAYYSNSNEAPAKNIVLGDASPGFNDYYGADGTNQYNLWSRTTNGTTTLKATLSLCNQKSSVLDAIQLATWNDFGEGTIMEPTVEEGFQSLDTIQKFTGVPFTENNLKEVYTMFTLRKQYVGNTTIQSALNQAFCYFIQLDTLHAQQIIDCISNTGAVCPSKPTITSSAAASGLVGSSFFYQVTASNGPITRYGASSLPAGFSINTTTGVITGTFVGMGTFIITDSATNSAGTGFATLTITVSGACPNAANVFIAVLPVAVGNTYQWQVNSGSGYVNVANNTIYSGVETDTLLISDPPTSMYGYIYRCAVTNNSVISYSHVDSLLFIETWTGNGGTTAWENTGNWNCGVLPDGNTDVIFISGTAVINSDVNIRSLRLSPGVHLMVNPANKLNVLH